MEAMLEKIDLNNLDKSNWDTYRFDELAEKISKTVKPEEAEVNIYVGLEHLDAEDIHIRRKGVPSDVKGGKLRCFPGDVIFGKRRAYLRKASIVDFEGICSAHAFVFRAKAKVIDPRLFPFFLHSDQFMHRMIDISVGGLSPTINWGDLKHQTFLIPPKDEQVKFVELLNSLDEMVEGFRSNLNKLEIFKKTKFKNLLFGLEGDIVRHKNIGELKRSWNLIPLRKQFQKITRKNKKLISDNVLTISAQDGLVNQEEYFTRVVASKNLKNYYLLEKGDFAYNKSYSEGYPAGAIKVLEKYDQGVVSPLYICFHSTCDRMYQEYYKHLFELGYLNNQILSVAKEGARNHGLLNVSTTDFFDLLIPEPKERDILKMLPLINKINESVEESLVELERSQAVFKNLINQIF